MNQTSRNIKYPELRPRKFSDLLCFWSSYKYLPQIWHSFTEYLYFPVKTSLFVEYGL